MKFPNWFKIFWWIILLIITGVILYYRLDPIIKGHAVPVDIFILLIFVALMLVPIFSEVELFGIKLKSEIDKLKYDLMIQIGEVKNDIRNTQNQTVQNFFPGFGPPPPDNKLPELENEIEEIIKERPVRFRPEDENPQLVQDVPEGNLQLFKIRYNIEVELRRIWENRFASKQLDKKLPLMRIIQDLTEYDIIGKSLSAVLKEILSICNYAIHGEQVTNKQIEFVTTNAQQVLEYLLDVR